jgi:hypothetical protein
MTTLRHLLLPLGLSLALAGWAGRAASEPEIFRGADLKLGAELIANHKCDQCHIRNVGGDGSDIYNPKGRIHSAAFLRGMIEYCSTQLNLGFFPEETTAVAAVINQRHYLFTK